MFYFFGDSDQDDDETIARFYDVQANTNGFDWSYEDLEEYCDACNYIALRDLCRLPVCL